MKEVGGTEGVGVTFLVLADFTDSVRKVVRAIPQHFSRKLALKIGEAHLEADTLEALKHEQAQAAAHKITEEDVDAFAETLANIFGTLQAKGVHVNVANDHGRIVIVAVRPEAAAALDLF